MLLASACALSLAVSPHLASVGFRSAGVDENTTQFLSSSFATSLAEATGLQVMTSEEIGAVLGVERQKQLLGCGDESTSCLAEIAAGLGAPALVLGSVAIIGKRWAVTVKVIGAKDAQVIAARTGDIPKDDNVLEWLKETARLMGPTVRRALAPELPPLEPQASGVRRLAWVPLVGAGVFAILGGVFIGTAAGDVDRVKNGDPSVTSAAQLTQRLDGARTLQGLAWGSWGLAVAGLATGAVMYFLGAPASASVWVFPSATGVMVGGQW